MIERHVDMNMADFAGDTALHVAARTSWCVDKAIELLLLGANPRAANEVGDTPLQCAAAAGSSSHVSALTQGGADVRAVNRAGQMPRDVAVERGHLALSFTEP
jgi:ankyrin repeat protein